MAVTGSVEGLNAVDGVKNTGLNALKKLTESEIRAAAEAMFSANSSQANTVEVTTEERYYSIDVNTYHLLLSDSFSSGEIVAEPSIFPLPNSPVSFLGLCYVRGELVPVYDLERLLVEGGEGTVVTSKSLAKSFKSSIDRNKRYLLIMGPTENHVGFLLTALPSVVSIDESCFEEYSPELLSKGLIDFPESDFTLLFLSSLDACYKHDDSWYLKLSWLSLSKQIVSNCRSVSS